MWVDMCVGVCVGVGVGVCVCTGVMCVCVFGQTPSRVQLSVTPWTVAH